MLGDRDPHGGLVLQGGTVCPCSFDVGNIWKSVLWSKGRARSRPRKTEMPSACEPRADVLTAIITEGVPTPTAPSLGRRPVCTQTSPGHLHVTLWELGLRYLAQKWGYSTSMSK